MFLDSMSRIQQSGSGQYNGSIEIMVRWNEDACGFNGGLKLKKPSSPISAIIMITLALQHL